jgi:hypothetical protein
MTDTLQTLALLNGKEIALAQARALAGQCVVAIDKLQMANAAEKAPIVASLQGVPTIGIKSQLTVEAEAERLVGIGAMIDAIKANPAIDPTATEAAWVAAVAAYTTNTPIENPVGVVTAIMRIINAPDWASFTAIIVAGVKADLIAAVS